MNKSGSLVAQLFSIRNRYGKKESTRKIKLLHLLQKEKIKSKKTLQLYYDILLFLIAYPDNKGVYQLASQSLQQLQNFLQLNEAIKDRLYNSGITNTELCAAYSFDLVKWLRKKHPDEIRFNSFDAADGQIQSILSVVMPKVESEILQDANADWKSWLKKSLSKGEDILDRLIAIFDETDIRPEVRDELWAAIGINVEIKFPEHHCLHGTLFTPYFHHSLIKKVAKKQNDVKAIFVDLNKNETEGIIECGRMILVRHLREIDPITFTAPHLVSYYQLPRGLSVALMGMVPERRHPIDSYMGYVVFKNGLPVAYAGSWILFDSGRIGLNVFPSYRGGESQYIFEQVLKLHSKVYKLNRFSVDPYQLGKENHDGIHSGAFWIYYHAGFRPIRKEQLLIAESEAKKIKTIKGYRSSSSVLSKLADSRMEILLQKNPVRFDATDISLAYADLLKSKYSNNRKLAEVHSFIKLAKLLQIKNYQEEKMEFVLKNWSVLLLSIEKEWRNNSRLKKHLKKLFELKANGSEEEYIKEVQGERELRKLLEKIMKEYIINNK